MQAHHTSYSRYTTTILATAAMSWALHTGALAQNSAAPTSTPSTTPADKATPAPKERLAAVKKSFMESQARLRSYQWIETTVIEMKEEEKSRKQSTCFYGADGKVQKVAITAPVEEKPSRGIRGKIKENKKEEITEYMKSAVALVHKYLPPDPEAIQKCADAGNASINIVEPGKRAKIELRDYHQKGDKLAIDINVTDNTILGVSVLSSLEDDKDPITLDVVFDKFTDGTIFTSKTTLDAKAKKLKVIVENSGHTKK